MRHDDRIRVQHMIESAEAIGRFVAGRRREDLDGDLMLLFAIVRALEILGEAAARISPETREVAPALPWRELAAMRNRIIHAYWDVNRDIVWKAATEEVPDLLPKLQALLAGHGDER